MNRDDVWRVKYRSLTNGHVDNTYNEAMSLSEVQRHIETVWGKLNWQWDATIPGWRTTCRAGYELVIEITRAVI